jgi:hypothetical protein
VDDVALAGSLAGGGADGVLGTFDAYADRLHAYSSSLLGEPDEAAGAVLDALLVAAGAARELADPRRLRPWLYALTRNECLRRRPGAPTDLAAEAAELARRHRLPPPEVAAVLGVPAEDADRLALLVAEAPAGLGPLPAGVAPPRLRRELAAAVAGDGPGQAAELARRARPFDPDGFPVPLDRRRLGVPALAWSAAVAVLVALGLLVTVPIGGGTAGAVRAGVAPAPAVPLPQSVPLVAGTSSAPRPKASRPAAAPDRGAHRRRTADSAAGAGPTTADSAPPQSRRLPPTTLRVEWQPRPERECGPRWTAELRVRPSGPAAGAVERVAVSWTDGRARRTVALRRTAGDWTAALAGLPADRSVVLTVRARTTDGSSTRPATNQLAHGCR